MIYTKLISGLGNQLFQYVVGRQLSILNNSELILDTSFFDSQDLRSYKLNHYNINASIANKPQIDKFLYKYSSDTVTAKVLRKIEKLQPKYKRSLFKEEKWWHLEPDLYKIRGNCYLEGYWQCYQYYKNLDPVIFNELTLKDNNELLNNNITNYITNHSSSVSIHIRRGDYITDTDANKLMGILPLDYYHKATDYIAETITNPTYFIFSDDLDWAKDNLQLSAEVVLVDIASGTKDYLELDLMSKCKHNIIANSSFSWWGAFLNRNPDKIVIAPRKWVVPENINSNIHLQFPEWVKF